SSANGGAPAAEGSDSVLHNRGIAMNDCDVVQVDSQLVGRDLGKRGLLSLPVRRDPGKNGDLAGGLDPHGCAFPAAGRSRCRWSYRANLDIGRNADSDKPALLARLLLILAQLLVPRHLERLVQSGLVVSAVIEKPCRRLEWELR